MAKPPPHICHLTLLNPALHSRIFYKEALSMVDAGLKVSVVGQSPERELFVSQGVEVKPISVFAPRSFSRFLSRKMVWNHAIEAEADIYVLHTPELLGLAKQLKRRFPDARFVYDMHEDYALNILEGGYYPDWLKGVLAKKVRNAEIDFAEWGDAVVYAEKCFEGILEMKSGEHFTLPNFFRHSNESLPKLPPIEQEIPLMLFCGTVAENWGILRALDIWVEMNLTQPVRLVVAGVVYDLKLKERILSRVAESGHQDRFFWWRNGEYVPHPEILAWIDRCDFGVAPYILRPNLKDRIPTRFYEFMAFGKNLIYTDNKNWNDLNEQTHFGIPVSWPVNAEEAARLLQDLEEKSWPAIPATEWNWTEQPELERYLSWLKSQA